MKRRAPGADGVPAPSSCAGLREPRARVPIRPSAPWPASDEDAQVSDTTRSQHGAGRRSPERQAGAVCGGGQRSGEEARRAGQPGPGCAYLELPPRRPRAPAPPGAAAPPRAAGAARTGAPRPRAPWGARGARRAGRGAAAGRWALGRSQSCGGATVGSRRSCRFVRSALCPPRPCPRRSLPARVPAAQLRTEAARRRPRLLVARGRPLPAAGRWGGGGGGGGSPGSRC